MEFRFCLARYGIDVPFVKPYSRRMCQTRCHARSALTRGATASGSLEAAASGLRRAGPRRADGRRRHARAGVGVGTVYRHFPTKEALIDALAVDRFEQVLARRPGGAARPRTRGRRSPARCGRGAELPGRRPRVHRDRRRAAGPMPLDRSSSREMNEIYVELIRRAQDVGRPAPGHRARRHPDVHVRDRHGDAQDRTRARDAWRRHLAIVIDGLRAANALRPAAAR